MQIEKVKVADLITPEENIRKHPDKQLEELYKSYVKFGQFRPVVIDENNYIWAGNGLVEALRRNNVETVDAYRKIGMSETDKRKLMLADNKTFALGYDNLQAIDDVMKSLDDFDIPGYDGSVLAQLYTVDEKDIEFASAMGVVPTAGIEAVEHTAQKRQEQEPVQVAPAPAPTPTASGEMEKAEEHVPEPKADVRKFVLCPKCGEKIWL